jgi:hypothetical protein
MLPLSQGFNLSACKAGASMAKNDWGSSDTIIIRLYHKEAFSGGLSNRQHQVKSGCGS